MKQKQFTIILLITLTIALLLAPSASRTSAVTSANKETPLNADGLVYEMFRDPNGELWISDYLADEIWHVNPTTSAYTVYEGLYSASDGRLDSSGDLWWSNPDGGMLGRLILGAPQATLWTLPAGSSPVGIAFDNSGNIWIADQFEPMLNRFAPGSNELCTYTLPEGDGASDYVIFHNGRIWLPDWVLGRILRLDPATGTFTIWQLADGAYPLGLALDGNNDLWWADNKLGELGRLDPQSNNISIFSIPGTAPVPAQLSIEGGKVWYSDQSGTVGKLDPALASASTTKVPPTTAKVTPVCQTIAAGSPSAVSTRSGSVVWSDADYPLAQNKDGWTIYQLPPGAAPYGLATNSDNVWFTDQGSDGGPRFQFLGWIKSAEVSSDSNIYLPVAIDN